jgi:hypothetical protein
MGAVKISIGITDAVTSKLATPVPGAISVEKPCHIAVLATRAVQFVESHNVIHSF